jgi:CBS domain-containing protein
MKARELMSSNPACCTPDDEIRAAARMMSNWDCGIVPVVEDKQSMRLVGVVTDRDLAVRGLARGMGGDARVGDVMTSAPRYCRPEDDLEAVERAMEEHQVRRIPIVDERGCCVGIVAQADLARAAERHEGVSEGEVAHLIERISEPGPQPGGTGAARQPEVGL